MKIIIGLLVLSVIVIIHELGHFIFAKRAGIRVEEFCVGLGPRLFHVTRGETMYSLKLFPIGGACIMTGEDGDEEGTDERSFQSKTVWQRISVVIAGPLFNFLLAFFVAWIFIAAAGVDLPKVGSVAKDSAASEAGLQAGDRILKFNGKTVHTYKDLGLKQFVNGAEPVELTYQRGEEERTTTLVPKAAGGRYVLGVTGTGKEKVGFFATIGYGANEVKYWVDSVFVSLKKIFTGQVSGRDVAGPVAIVNMIGSSVDSSRAGGLGAILSTLAFFTILISANLGVMNLLPIPALDGGRLLFLLVELVRGKRLNPKVEGYVNMAGFILLMGLMVFMFYNDISNLIR
ncbi:MAG: RIP metalloprotease RseP [Eubacteriales bacterium]|nr:RIP metalloprotease RseP [Eubacteriales bacterium]